MWKKNTNQVSQVVRAYASLLQQYLDVPVVVADLYYAGWFGPVQEAPCSLVTIEPFCPGGQRRLVLNSLHPLIIELARAAFFSTPGSKRRKGVLAMGEAMTWTASWPISGLDVSLPTGHVYWNGARGSICGSHFKCISPVRHERIHVDGVGSETLALAVWPKIMSSMDFKMDNSDPSAVEEKTSFTLLEKWKRRDAALLDEWRYIEKNMKRNLRNRFPLSKTTLGPTDISSIKRSAKIEESPSMRRIGMATFSPSLPVFALAQLLQRPNASGLSSRGDAFNYTRAERTNSLGAAAEILLSCDRLFCLSLFFNAPLIDRTKTLRSCINVEHVARMTPSISDVNQYREVAPVDAYSALEEAMLKRAKTIWSQSKGRQLLVCWSGGINSTALLVCLLRTSTKNRDVVRSRDKLSVICDKESVSQNVSFYTARIQSKIPIIARKGRTISEMAQTYPDAIVVTGELGDQIFGSSKFEVAFPPSPPSGPSPADENALMASGSDRMNISLNQAWEDTLPIMLQRKGLLAGAVSDWKRWIAPQLEKAPFPIINLHDMLWWINFSCEWQPVTLRYLHDGGSVVHFYDDRDLECWSCVEEFHRTKFGDLNDWKSYKEPLKKLIFSFHADEVYYREKEKVASLSLALNESQVQVVESCAGLVLDSKGKLAKFLWGSGCITNCQSGPDTIGLEDFLDPWILSTSPVFESKIVVDPWKFKAGYISPFVAASCFFEKDERQRRPMNPITAITLEAKCCALLPPDLVQDKIVLDLGACLGAMCHWSLYHGAKKAVAVEPQKDFCDRMEVYMQSAENTWPEMQGPSLLRRDRYDIVCADARTFLSQCEDKSFDIVVAAGVLHCFQDPVSILSEIGRVCKEVVAIESVHPIYHRKGFQCKANTHAVNMLELAPSAAVNKAGEDASFAGVAVIPSKDLMKNMFSASGFSVSSVVVSPHPTKNEDIFVYTGNKWSDVSPIRFFLRCIRKKESLVKLRSLESAVVTGHGNVHGWAKGNSDNWNKFGVNPNSSSS